MSIKRKSGTIYKLIDNFVFNDNVKNIDIKIIKDNYEESVSYNLTTLNIECHKKSLTMILKKLRKFTLDSLSIDGEISFTDSQLRKLIYIFTNLLVFKGVEFQEIYKKTIYYHFKNVIFDK